MKTSIEEINGKKCTVIRRDFDAEWVKSQLDMGIPITLETKDGKRWTYRSDVYEMHNGVFGENFQKFKRIITILPPLPAIITAEHATNVLGYIKNGIYPLEQFGEMVIGFDPFDKKYLVRDGGRSPCMCSEIEIDGAEEATGERVEIAIEGE